MALFKGQCRSISAPISPNPIRMFETLEDRRLLAYTGPLSAPEPAPAIESGTLQQPSSEQELSDEIISLLLSLPIEKNDRSDEVPDEYQGKIGFDDWRALADVQENASDLSRPVALNKNHEISLDLEVSTVDDANLASLIDIGATITGTVVRTGSPQLVGIWIAPHQAAAVAALDFVVSMRPSWPGVLKGDAAAGQSGNGGDAVESDSVENTQSHQICVPRPEAHVRLQATDLSGNPVAQVDVGDQYYLQAYVSDTRNGIPEGISMATVAVAYDASQVSLAGEIEYGDRFPNGRTGRTGKPGLLDHVGASISNVNWTDKATPTDEDLLYQVLMTADSAGSVEFLSGEGNSGQIFLRGEGLAVPNREIDYGRLTLTIGSDAVESDSAENSQSHQICIPRPEAHVRLQATDLSGNPVAQVDVGDQYYLQAYVSDTRNGIPEGISMATVAVAYDASQVSLAGEIEYGDRFPNGHTGRTGKPGLLDHVGASIWNVNWTDKANPTDEDLLYQVLMTADSAGSVEFLSGEGTSGQIFLRGEGLAVPNREINYGRLTLTIGSDAVASDSAENTQSHQICIPRPEAHVRLQATDLSGNPVAQVDVGDQYYLQAYVSDTRNGIPEGISMATVAVAYDASQVSLAGEIEYGDRFPNGRTGRTGKAGLLDHVGASIWNVNWTDKANPSDEDMLFQVLMTADSAGSVEFLSGEGNSGEILLRGEGLAVPNREIDYGRLTLTIGSDAVESDSVENTQSHQICIPRPEAHVRLQATDLSGNPVAQVAVGDQYYLQAYVSDTRNGIPEGISMATVAVAYDASQVSLAGEIEYGDRFPDGRTGRTGKAGLLDHVGASIWNVNWTDKANPTDEDLLYQVLMTADSAGSVEFLSGEGNSGEIFLRGEGLAVPNREIDYGRLTLTIGSGAVDDTSLPVVDSQLSIRTGAHNVLAPFDVNDDGVTSPLDVLRVINVLNGGIIVAPLDMDAAEGESNGYPDVNNDGQVTPLDALLVINHLNSSLASGEGHNDVSRALASAIQREPSTNTVPNDRSTAASRSELDLAVSAIDSHRSSDELFSEIGKQNSEPVRRASANITEQDRLFEAIDRDLLTTLADDLLHRVAS